MTPLSTPAAQGTVPEMTVAQIDAAERYIKGKTYNGHVILPPGFNWHELWQAILSASPSPEALPASGVEAELRAALQLAKDMFIANNLSLPHTFEVIDRALASDASPRGEAPHAWIVSWVRDGEEGRDPEKDRIVYDPAAIEAEMAHPERYRVTKVYAHPAPATVESVRALPYLIHLARQRWDGNWSYTLEELADRWLAGQFHNDAAESDAKAAALAPATEGRRG